jgi:hypothetical protein
MLNELTGSIPRELGELTSSIDLALCTSIDLSCWPDLSRWLTFPFHSFLTDTNRLTGSIPIELGELTSMTYLSLGTLISLFCWEHDCHAGLHFLAILFEHL